MLPRVQILWRRFILSQLSKASPQGLRAAGEKRLLAAFGRAAEGSRAYATLLAEHGVDRHRIASVQDFSSLTPRLDKSNTFARFSVEELSMPGTMGQLAGVLTSSGQGGRFAYGLSTWKQARGTPGMIDLGLQQAFGTDDRRTLLVNCLPMGVRFNSGASAVADVSVREDMALAVLGQFGPHFEQAVLFIDPVFGKRLLDHADETGFDWRRFRVHAVIGEETFGERYREYVARKLGAEVDAADGGFIGSSMGVGELGLNLFFETRDTVRLRRLLERDGSLRAGLFGETPLASPPPVVFAYNPLRTFVEVLDPDPDGFGALAVSMVDPGAAVPLMRYLTGDTAKLLADDDVDRLRASAGPAAERPAPFPLIAVAGRQKDVLPSGRSVLDYKDALYADPAAAERLSGAVRLEWRDGAVLANVQLRRGAEPDQAFERALAKAMTRGGDTPRIACWRYAEFPWGMTLDYERKFAYWVG